MNFVTSAANWRTERRTSKHASLGRHISRCKLEFAQKNEEGKRAEDAEALSFQAIAHPTVREHS